MARLTTRGDVDRVTEIIALAFTTDPVWGVALARPDGSTVTIVQRFGDPTSKPAMLELWDRFTAARPQDALHAYLSLLAYLESTNLANNRCYERAGFSHLGSFDSTFDSAPIATMWRPVGGSGVSTGRRSR